METNWNELELNVNEIGIKWIKIGKNGLKWIKMINKIGNENGNWKIPE